MDAISFYRKFKSEVKEDRVIDGKPLFEIYKNSSEFTPVITNIINGIIKSAGDGYESQNEYFRIDAVGWVSHSEEMKADAEKENIKLNAHLWDLKIAVEHENSKTDWSDEVMKLIHVKCPLKVIIGYNFFDEREDIEVKKLDFVAKWMQKIDAFSQGIEEEYLIILGNGANRKSGLPDYTDFGYIGYLYNWNDKRFIRIDE